MLKYKLKRSIRHLNEDNENGQENFTNGIESLKYAYSEQYKGKKVSYSTVSKY